MGGILIADFKFCKNCGRKVSLNGQFCARCGANLGAPEEQNVLQDAVTGEVVVGAVTAKEWRDKGFALGKSGRLQEALQCYDKALAIDPKNADAWIGKGAALDGLTRLQEALQCCDKALAIDPKNAMAWAMKGAVLNELHRDQEAIPCIDKALAIDPQNVAAQKLKQRQQLNEWQNKAVDAVASDRPEEAVRYYDEALKIDPHNARLWNLKGAAFTVLNQYPTGLTCFEKAIEIDPQYPEPWGNKGLIFVNSGKWDDAVSCCNQALALSQERPLGNASIEAYVWVTKGNALLYSYKFKEALDSFEKARELDPQNALAHQGIRQAREVMSQVGI